MQNRELLEQLASPDEATRAAAREELSLVMDDEIVRAMLDVIAENTDADIVADTIIGLGPIIEEVSFDDDEEEEELDISRETFDTMVRELRSVYYDGARPTLVRRRAFEVLVRDPQPWQADAIRTMMAAGDREWTLTAVFAMGYVPGFDQEIASLVETAEGDLLAEAVRAAALREVTETAPRVRELATKASDLMLQLTAIDALPGVDPRSRPLLEKLARAKNKDVAEAAKSALEELDLWEMDDDI